MATKKQKKRREKERRHEYEYVYVDAEGREVEAEDGESAVATASNGKAPSSKPVQAGGRTVQPPSWRRTFRRALMFAPFMFLVLYLLRPKDAAIAAIAFNVLVLLAFFLPFSYFMDSIMYRMAVKRGAKTAGAARKTTGAGGRSARK